jgi:type I restriction enzyme S subunit
MPSHDWRQHTFAGLIEAGILQIGDGYRAENAELGGDGPIFLRAGHVTDTHIEFEGVDRFRTDLADRVRPKMAIAADVIVTTKGNSTGRVAYVTELMPPSSTHPT